jgi:hypothetical protein
VSPSVGLRLLRLVQTAQLVQTERDVIVHRRGTLELAKEKGLPACAGNPSIA